MMYKNKDIEKLLAKYFIGNITSEEHEILDGWINSSDCNNTLFQKLGSGSMISTKYKAYSKINSDQAWLRFKKRHVRPQRVIILRYAAMLLLPILIACGIWYYHHPADEKAKEPEIAEAILPGIPRATLTLPGNKKKVLTGNSTSPVNINKSTVAVPNRGILIYPSSTTHEEIALEDKRTGKQEEQKEDTGYDKNTLETKDGNEFWVKLEDGTTIHLNYNTELRYPVKFGIHERTVYLKGEAYFKIAKDSRPFYVVTEEGSIKQYGTEFNVNTFTPGRTEVVLIRGKISISTGRKNHETFLKPGQLANLQKENGDAEIRNVDPSSYVGWDYGRFIFNNATLENIMQTLKHWYGVEVHFERDSLKNLHFTGNMDRYGTISPILQAIAQTTNLQISIKERRITISSFN